MRPGPVAVIALVGLAALLVFIAFTMSCCRQDRRRVALAAEAESAAAGEGAWAGKMLLAALSRDNPPPPLSVWDVALHAGETAHLQLPIGYSRYYGRELACQRSGGFYAGPASTVALVMAVDQLADSMARSRARKAARRQWRDHQQTSVILTDQRLICPVDGLWASFYYSEVTAFYPDLTQRSVTVEFCGKAPLRVHGTTAPSVMVYLGWALQGPDSLRHNPHFTNLWARPVL